jgi:hypothetical protein
MWGKVVASPEFGLWWVLWVQGCPWLVLATKVLQPCANQLAYWFCIGLLDWASCLTLVLVPSRSSNMAFYPSKVLRTGSVPRDPNLSIASILRLSLSLPRGLGLRQMIYGTPKSNGFWHLQSLLEDLGVHRDSKSQSGSSIKSVEVQFSHFPILSTSREHKMWLSGFILGLHLCKPLPWS